MSTGWKTRRDILRGHAEQKIVEPLREHQWTIHEIREVEVGEYLVIDVERGGQRHKIGLLYSSATANDVYKRLATEVEHIYVDNGLYQLQSFAYGVEKPISAIDDFRDLLVSWNSASTEGRFAPTSESVVEAGPAKERSLLAEAPIDAIWLRIRQLGSVTLARKLVEARDRDAGMGLDAHVLTEKAQGLAYSVRNATDYYRTHDRLNVSQRVLNLYYGSLAFAFAEMLASPNGPRTLGEIEDNTKQGHGLYTLDGDRDGLEHLVVGAISQGFFPAWMKVLGVSIETLPAKKPRLFSDLGKLPLGSWTSVEQLFARIPEVADLFVDIFETKPGWVTPVYDQRANMQGLRSQKQPTSSYVLLVDDSARLTKEDIAAFPGPLSEISEVPVRLGTGELSTESGRHFRAAVDHSGKKLWWDALQIHHSPFERDSIIQPVFGVGEYRAISLVLLYALSIVVRYRPSVWRRVQEGDLDHLRVLIEAFLAVVERVLPEQFLETITGQKIFVRQPGSFF
jgi:hypothetical protein